MDLQVHLQPGEHVRYYLIRLVTDPIRYEPRNVGVVAWCTTGKFVPRVSVDADALLRVYQESGLWPDMARPDAVRSSKNIELYVLSRLSHKASDSDGADKLINETNLSDTFYTPLLVVERPGTTYVSEDSIARDPRRASLEGLLDVLTERLIDPPTPR